VLLPNGQVSAAAADYRADCRRLQTVLAGMFSNVKVERLTNHFRDARPFRANQDVKSV